MGKERESNLKREGEGSYEGAKQFRDSQHEFARNGPVKAKAREAADALDGDEAKDLERARATTAKGAGKS